MKNEQLAPHVYPGGFHKGTWYDHPGGQCCLVHRFYICGATDGQNTDDRKGERLQF